MRVPRLKCAKYSQVLPSFHQTPRHTLLIFLKLGNTNLIFVSSKSRHLQRLLQAGRQLMQQLDTRQFFHRKISHHRPFLITLFCRLAADRMETGALVYEYHTSSSRTVDSTLARAHLFHSRRPRTSQQPLNAPSQRARAFPKQKRRKEKKSVKIRDARRGEERRPPPPPRAHSRAPRNPGALPRVLKEKENNK